MYTVHTCKQNLNIACLLNQQFFGRLTESVAQIIVQIENKL